MKRTTTLHPGEFVTVPAGWRLEADDKPGDIVAFEAALVGEIAAAEGDDSAPKRFTMTAYTGGPMSVGFGDQVVVDLAGVRLHADQLPILRDHDRSRVLGHSETIEITSQTIKVKGVLSGANEHTREVVESARQSFPWRASIGASIERMEFVREGTSVKVNGRTWAGPVYIAREAKVTEISVVAIPADPKSTTRVAASAQTGQEHIMNFEAWLRSKNLILADLSETRIAALRAEYDAGVEAGTIKAEEGDPAPAPAPKSTNTPTGEPTDLQARMQAERELRAAEEQRIADIQAAAPKPEHAAIRAQAIREGWDKARTTNEAELVDLRASRSSIGAITGRAGVAASIVLEAALCQACGLPNIEKAYDEQTLQAAHTEFHGRIGLQEFLLTAAHGAGFTGRTFNGNERAVLQAAFSTIDVPGILSNVANKFMLESFMAVERTWEMIAAIRSVRNFQTVTSYRMTGDLKFQKVGPDGELKHATLGEASFTNKAETHGRIAAITRNDLINDDLGAFIKAPAMMGRGGALQLNTVFWTEFMDNATFFASGNANYASGSGTALGIAAFTQAETLFFNQTDPDGNPVAVSPAFLLVPNALHATATQLMESLEMRDTTASTKTPTNNPHRGKAKVARSSYLSNTGITGNSTTQWYLLADPRDLAAIEVCFLNGNRTPTIETAQADFDQLGIQLRGYWDFGVGKQEHRAGVAMKGTA